jgi:multidrug efflux pump subunit AcrB
MSTPLGPAGRLAQAFVHSRLTPLFMVASIALGVLAVVKLPREEEPQIKVPMVDVFVAMPGSSAKEVEQRVTKPMEKLLWEIPGVEYLYSTTSPGQALVIVRFQVGEDEERSLVKLNQKLQANFDLIPPGASLPLVKPRSIDDVPVLGLTLHSQRYGAFELRRIAAQLQDEIAQVPGVSQVVLIGGQRREIRVTLDPVRLDGHSLAPLEVWRALGESNQRLPAGTSTRGGRESIIESGDFLRSAEDVRSVVVAARGGRPVFVRDVAEVTDQGAEPADYVSFHTREGAQAAVTIAVSKRKSLNAIEVADNVLHRVEGARARMLPGGVEMTITRHYGETAAEKSNELLLHMALAVVSVSLLVALVLGFRESLVVFAAIPVTLALTLTMFYLSGYTLNRITLFALIFSIGILVDDAIVVVENIVRHARLVANRGRALAEVAVEAVNEVGNPTILATLAVVAAILPMAFVGGMMGPYMRPIPFGATAAMVFSLLVAFIVTPWAAVRLLANQPHGEGHEAEDKLTQFYRRFMAGVLSHPVRIAVFLSGVVVLLVGAMVLVPVGFVKVKMLPFDNKNEFQVIIDMPEGTPLEETRRVAVELARAAMAQPEVVNAQTYAGISSPYNFNGLVRHYYLRQGSNVADIQLNLLGKGERDQQSHQIAKQVRERLLPLARRLGANIKVAEVPPGPPVLQTLVAEIYGPTGDGQRRVAAEVRRILEATPGVVDTDWYVEDPQPKLDLQVDHEKAALHGVTAAAVARTLRLATSGEVAGSLHAELEQETVPVTLRLDRAARADLTRLRSLKVAGTDGRLVALSEITHVVETTEAPFIYHKNLMPVTYVTADVAGEIESPVYAILKIGPEIEKYRPEGYEIVQYVARQPVDDARYALKWDGEWHITYEVFRDLGLAFAAVLVLIYVLVVGWFESFVTPLVIMAAIPFSLVGILPAHGLLSAFFTATSMIGFIAGAGIVVRNSIILVDFIELRLKEGMPLQEAVVDAGAVRFRPMLLTAAAVAVGAAVILFDPIFQGLAISLMAGEIASLALSRLTVPILYYVVANRRSKS